jgi:uncharacterized RDD family membrane protein YckC
MKCPKCGYLGFETTDRCRNCQYDFSLAPFISEAELTLQGPDRRTESTSDFELPAITRQTDGLGGSGLDLDRLFGDPEPAESPSHILTSLTQASASPSRKVESPTITLLDDEAGDVEGPIVDSDLSAPFPEESLPAIAMSFESEAAEPEPQLPETPAASADGAALPFDDGPIVPPLAVRRSTPEVPRNRPRTTRPARMLDLEPAAKSGEASQAATDTVASLMEMPSLGARVGAGLIDLLLLVGIDAAVVFLTLRVTGLQNTLEDLRVLSPVPFVGFLATLAFGYVAAFTVAGGQTIGKMLLSLRVIGDDGRPVDAAGGMLRALGCMLVPITLGLSYLPALFTSDHRAIHDRLAGTRVVQE